MDDKQKQQIDAAYEKIKAIYKKKGAMQSFYTFYRFLSCPLKRIFHLIPKGNNYIDVGCGFGFISLWTALVFPDARVTGMDVVPSRITLASQLAKNENINNLEFKVKDITKDTVEDAEIILLIDLFHHVPFESQLPFLKQCMDKTPPGGWIVFKDIDRKPWWKFRVNYIQDYLFTGEKTYSRNKDEYMEFFKQHGFEVEYFDLKKKYAYSHYLIRAHRAERCLRRPGARPPNPPQRAAPLGTPMAPLGQCLI
ncbi:MAG: class I SAM-dependent methyltransferase [bacterium]|nr:class I SAM-dependent methyltransferase [bacterium]